MKKIELKELEPHKLSTEEKRKISGGIDYPMYPCDQYHPCDGLGMRCVDDVCCHISMC